MEKLDKKIIGPECIESMEKSAQELFDVYTIHRTPYEREVLRIYNFLISYFYSKINETYEGSISIQVSLTETEEVCIGNPAAPVAKKSIYLTKNTFEFEQAFEESINFLKETKGFYVVEPKTKIRNALKCYSLTFRPKKS